MKSLLTTMSMLALASLAPPAMAGAEPDTICAAQLAPYVLDNEHGPALRIVREAGRRLGWQGQVQVLPMARALLMAKDGSCMVFPLAMSPERLEYLDFGPQLMSESLIFAARSEDAASFSSIDVIRKTKVVTLLNSITEDYLRREHYADIDTVSNNQIAARMLAAKRVDIWFSGQNVARYCWKEAGYNAADLKIVAKVSDLSLYLAFRKGTPAATMARWREAIEAMRKDGTLATLMAQD